MEEAVSEELKPCPFCGGEAALTCHDNHYVAQCMNDMCGVSAYTELRYPQSAESAAAAWNTRFERTCRNVMNEAYAFECSGCGCTVAGGDELGHDSSEGAFRFCPNCGARVKGADE